MRGAAALLDLALGLVLGCTAEPPPAPAPAASGEAAPAPIALPRSSVVPAGATTRPLDRAQLARLAAIEHPGFARSARGASETTIEFRHTTEARPRLGVTVQLARCDPPASCPAMTLEAWAAKRDELSRALPAELAGRTRIEIGPRVLSGAIAISTYQLGAAFGSDAGAQPTGTYIHAYSLDHNDRVNRLRVTASYLDDTVGGVDRLLAIAPREDLEKLALAFLGFYLHHWQ
jgi:hypothetical protein